MTAVAEMDPVRCTHCGGVVRWIAAGQPVRPGRGERCGDAALAEGRFDLYEKLRRDCLARKRGERNVGVQLALPGQQLVRPQTIRRRKETT